MTKLRGAYSGSLFRELDRLFGHGTSIGSSEGELLERFVTGRDEAAFEALVARHGPMVLGVCRQLLRDPNDVDDAFQATFLILIRKAGTLRRRDLLGNWLYGVAYRVAARAREQSARRTARVSPGRESLESLTATECGPDIGLDRATLWEEGPWLHLEVSHLPEKYRVPIVLCYFEGLTHDQAASRLGWPLGTVKGRIARARELLRRRLTRRGITLSAAALASHLAITEAKAAVPAAIRLATLEGAHALACHVGASLAKVSAVSLRVSALVDGVLFTMIAKQVQSIAFISLLVAGTVATGVVVGATQLSKGSANAGKATQVPVPATNSDAIRKVVAFTPGSEILVSPQLAQQLSAARISFGQLLQTMRKMDISDIDRLSQWSLMTLGADQVLANSDGDRVASFEAHRDRMKRLHEFTQQMPVAVKSQPVKADYAQNILQQAEEWLDNARHGQRTPVLERMLNMAGRAGEMGVTEGGRMGAVTNKGTMAKTAVEPASSTGPVPAGEQITAGAMRGRMGAETSPAALRSRRLQSIAASATDLASRDTNPQCKAILKRLEEPIAMSFEHETPLEDVLKYIKQATTTETSAGIPIYVDPKGLEEAEATLQSSIRLDLQGVPLKAAFRLALKQIGLAYCVRDGVVIVSSVQGVFQELLEAQSEMQVNDPKQRLQ